MRVEKDRASSSSTQEVSEHQIEAARYAVLRRLWASLRHRMVKPLQPIVLSYGLMKHELAAAEPDLQTLRTQADKGKEFAEAAVAQCVDFGTWLAPEPGVLTEAGPCVMECVGLLATDLHFRGFHLLNEVGEPVLKVSRDALRMVLIASVLEVTDALTEPATLTLSDAASTDGVAICLQVSLGDEGHVEDYDDSCRKLLWSDVQALAAVENVGLQKRDKQMLMHFPGEAAQAAC